MNNETIKDIYYYEDLKEIFTLRDDEVYKLGKYVIRNGILRPDTSVNQAFNFDNKNGLNKSILKEYIKDSYNLKLQKLNKDNKIYNIKNI